jgi:hypothetical protein
VASKTGSVGGVKAAKKRGVKNRVLAQKKKAGNPAFFFILISS